MAEIVQRGGVLLSGDTGVEFFGSGTSLSNDGTVLAVGAERYLGGRVFIYDWSGAWVQRGSVLAPADGGQGFGYSTCLSADGSVLAVGAPGFDGTITNQGGVYIFDWSGTAWVQRGGTLVAADAGASGEAFGSAVSLSNDGSVLVVGARYRGPLSAQGGVYIYDWSGTAWVQRGGVLLASDGAASAFFGQSVSLSGAGDVLAVGAYGSASGGTNRGTVYLYDWGGSAWMQRGSALSAGDKADYDYFGYSVSLSDSGAVLAVGAQLWEGTITNQGGVYLYDWVGINWVQRGAVLVAGDALAYAQFGTSVTQSGDGAVLVVGATPATAPGRVYTYDVTDDTGTPYARTALTIEPSTDAATAATSLTVLPTGTVSAATLLVIAPIGIVSAPTLLTVTWPTGSVSAQAVLMVTSDGSVSAPALLAVVSGDDEPNWTARCVIAGVDVSAQLVGQASVTAEEGAARIAEVTLLPPSGTIAPLDYVGKIISLDYVLVIGGVDVPRRIFTGRIDTPAYDPDTMLLSLTCTDDLPNVVAALDRSVIDALVGGRFSAAVQGEMDDNWDYAQARLATVAASLDAGASGGLRLTQWESATVWATWGEADLLYQRASLSLPQRSRLTNRVDIAFDYRYNRLRQRFAASGWSGTQIDMAPAGWAYPTQQDLLGAASGTGWQVSHAVFYPAPAAIPHSSGGVIYPAEGSIDMAILQLTQRHSQSVTEGYTLTVTAPESIAANGELAHAMRGALASEFSGSAWESALDIEPFLTSTDEIDHAPDAPRADADYAIQTLLDQARVKILGSHRSARVGNAVLCNPDLDIDKRVAIATASMSAAGKVASVTHTLDFDAGSAISAFELAVFGAGGAGILTPDLLDPPADPSAEADDAQDWPSGVVALMVNVYGSTPYQEDLMGLLINPPETITVEDVPGEGTVSYPNPSYVSGSYPITGFRMRMPGVDDASRNPITLPVSQAYSIVIPPDQMNFTIP